MSLPAIRDEYRIPARLGARVTVNWPTWRPFTGTVKGSWEDMVRIQPDSDPYPHLVHPDYLTFHTTNTHPERPATHTR